MNGFTSHAGFNITRYKLQVVEVVQEAGNLILSNINEVFFNQPLIFDKQKDTIIAAQLQSALDELQIISPLKSKNVSFALPFELFYIAQLPYDSTLLHQDLLEEFRWEFSILYPFIPSSELTLQYLEIEKNMVITKNTAIVTGMNRKYIKLLKNLCSRNNLSLQFIDAADFASEMSVAFSDNFTKDGLNLNLFFTNNQFSLLILFNSKPVFHKLISLEKDANVIKLINDEIKPSGSKFIQRDLIESAYISGEDIPGHLVENLSKSLNVNFYKFNPFSKIKINPRLERNTFYREKYNSFAPAAGIAYRLM